ncbi:1-acyl-sn-glycerol-3-phosphate acyltransferase [Domibacillus antri]|uniref:1-acyl-sn-glycerol-3-phosphate acyltransferase n=1 Tax=Domibacillus antri TaxID=1714264 RepID=A0A1Q8Q7D5_9BACI|nr:lysophospholipid acyltransferase family protein [Domibacillus antri]OLN23254.1 1-acyl-sn-glycerol-3-phosphate acyltransferase [Domibacillus antri]
MTVVTFYTVAKTVVKIVLTPVYRIQVTGLEHFPEEGGVLLCANHIDNLDPPVVGITSKRPVRFMAKEELFRLKWSGKLMRGLNAFPVKRGMSDREALRSGLKLLKEGQVLGLFPEGTRSKDGRLGKGLAGAGFFALRTEAAVVPCAVLGPYKIGRKLKVVYGPPIDMQPLRDRKASAEEATETIMNAIGRLIQEHSA